jgi:hypothetical protein
MSAVIVGSPISGGKVLQRQNFQRDINGLETISENYMIRTADRATIAPEKDTTHASFSSATTKYSRMAVETISFSEGDGGLTTMSVVYVGLTSSTGLPKPVVRMIPTTGAGIYGPPLTIEVEFVTDLLESEFANGQLVKGIPTNQQFTNVGLGRFITMPSELNGLALPSQPRPLGITQSSIDGSITYYGYCMDNLDSTRRGQFLVAKAVFKEKQFGIGAFAYATQV